MATPKSEFKLLSGDAQHVESEIRKLTTQANWRPILMTSATATQTTHGGAVVSFVSLHVIVEHVLGT